MLSKVFASQTRGAFKAVNTCSQVTRPFGSAGRHHNDHKVVVKPDPTKPHVNVPEDWQFGKTVKAEVPLIQDTAHLKYKKYPSISHNDPKSPDYIHSERDEYHDSMRVRSYNKVIHDLRRDLKIQEAVYRILEKLDKPNKDGVPGVNKNVTGGIQNYFPKQDLGFTNDVPEDFHDQHFKKFHRNKDRFLNQTVFYPKYAPLKNYTEWQKEYESRPATNKFHADKGYKYDIDTPYEERYPHVADRLGYPEILGTPFERLMRLEGDIFHPVYLDQPFVQVPGADPDPSLNFEAGEVIYENTQIVEWAKFWNLTALSLYGFLGFFVPYQLLYKTHMPLSTAYDNLFVQYYNQSPYAFDLAAHHVLGFTGVALYSSYVGLNYAHKFWSQYVVKMQYNKDKELLFVTRITPWCSLEEEVYEVNHLEVLPPSVKVGVADMSARDEDGLWDVQCLNTLNTLVLYNNPNYWNPTLRKEFFDKVLNFWNPTLVGENRSQEILSESLAEKVEIGEEKEIESPKIEGKIDAKSL